MNFVTWSIRNPVPVIILFIGLTIAGLISFPKLGVQDRPDIEFPAVIVTITYPGVAPTQMESEITRKVEDSVATISGIEQMTSTVDEGASTTSIEFAFGTDLSRALDDVRDAVTRIRSDLPPDANEPIVSRTTTAGGSLVTWSVASDTMTDTELSWFVDLIVIARAELGQWHGPSHARRRSGSRDPRRPRPRPHGGARGDCQRRVPPAAQDPGRVPGRRGAPRRPRAERAHDRHHQRRFTTSPACRSPCPTAAACGSTRSPTCATRRASSARSRCLNGKPVIGFRDSARLGRERARRREGRAQGRRPARKRLPAREVRRGELDGRLHPDVVRLVDGDAGRGRDPRHLRRLAVPARLARDAHLRARAASVDHPDVLGYLRCSASR